MTRLELACAADGERYVGHSAAMIHSVLRHAPGARVHYLCSPELPQATRDALAGMVDAAGGAIEFRPVADNRIAGLPPLHGSTAMWYRLFLPELLADLDRVLYLDVDTIAVDALAPLWETDVGDNWVGAVTNVFQHDHLHIPAELGMSGPERYFNTGVLLMNLAAMRRDDCARRLVDYSFEHADELIWQDQDAFNVVLSERRLPLHPRWNAMNSVMEFPSAVDVFGAEATREARARPGIRHFEGPSINKPWHYACDRALRDVYFEHRRATPWPDVEIEGRTPLRVLRRLLSA